MLDGKCLVLGATGFLGSHVTRQLAAGGNDVRVVVRPGSNPEPLEGLSIERIEGNPFDADTLRGALADVRYVFYCIVDARSWLRDNTPLWKTNVEELARVLNIVAGFELEKFVFTSTLVTIGLNDGGVSTEDDVFNWAHIAPDYVLSRVKAEEMVLHAAAEGRIPAVACCVSNTYGAEDFQPTPHGKSFVIDVARGNMPAYFDGGAESVGIRDAARGLIAAAERGRSGERYIISERYLSMQEHFRIVAECAGSTAPERRLPNWLVYSIATLGDVWARVANFDNRLSRSSLNLMRTLPRLDHSKAERELGWVPRPVEMELAEAVEWYRQRGTI